MADSSYKSAGEAIAGKRAALRNMQQNDQLNDFARAEPVKSMRPLARLAIDEDQWANRVKSLSAIFAAFPAVKNSGVELDASEGGFYLLNSEGTEVREPESATFLRARAIAQAPDGMTLRDAVTFHAVDAAHLPGDAEMRSGITALAESEVALANAPRSGRDSCAVLSQIRPG